MNSETIQVIMHGCNAQGVMGSGFAKELRERYPEAYTEYTTIHNSRGLELGDNVLYNIPSTNIIISNSITQQYYGRDGKKYVSYDAIDKCTKDLYNLLKMELDERPLTIHFPAIGAGLGGGDWDIISTIIDKNCKDGNYPFYKKLYIL